MVSQMLTNAAREGGRSAIIDGATKADVESDIQQLVSQTVGCQNNDITVDIFVTSVATENEVTNLEDAEQRDLIEIDITVPFNAISYSGGRFLTGQTLRGQCAVRKE